jgi:REP element-mobilizing transposase RayT
MLKGITARKLFMTYPELKTSLKKGVLWNHSYYVETIGSVSEENICKYIEKKMLTDIYRGEFNHRNVVIKENCV